MDVRYGYGAIAAIVFTSGVLTASSAYAQRRDGSLLPLDESGHLTIVGCLRQGNAVRGGHEDQYVLAKPRGGPVASVPVGPCTASAGDDAIEIENTRDAGVSPSMLGHWVEAAGELEKETDKNPDNLREVKVTSVKLVPVVPPAPPPSAQRAPPPPAAQSPTAPAAVEAHRQAPRHLPHTASNLPSLGLIGLLLVGAGVLLRAIRVQERG